MLRPGGLLDAIADLGANERPAVIFSTELLVQTVLSGLMVGVLYALMALLCLMILMLYGLSTRIPRPTLARAGT